MFRTTHGAVGVLTMMWAGQSRDRFCQERKEIFLSPKSRGRHWEPLTLLFNPYMTLFPPDVKRPERGTDH